MFLLKLANTLLVHDYVNCFAVGRRSRSLFVKKSLYFEYKTATRVISSPTFSTGARWIVYTRNSQLASSLSKIRVLCSTLTMSSFPPEVEKNMQFIKISWFLQ